MNPYRQMEPRIFEDISPAKPANPYREMEISVPPPPPTPRANNLPRLPRMACLIIVGFIVSTVFRWDLGICLLVALLVSGWVAAER